jgi:HK97 family phage prohead protease
VADGILIRTGRLSGVEFRERVIDMVVVPYETETVVLHQGRRIRELFERGAFGRITADRRRFPVNRGHLADAVVGKAISFDPDAPDGLLASVRIAQTELGDETLQLASEGLLDASVGYRPKRVVWADGRSLMRVASAWLEHIALVPDPAYTDARVLAVRAAEPPPGPAGVVPTPLLDEVRGWKLNERFASIGRE